MCDNFGTVLMNQSKNPLQSSPLWTSHKIGITVYKNIHHLSVCSKQVDQVTLTMRMFNKMRARISCI